MITVKYKAILSGCYHWEYFQSEISFQEKGENYQVRKGPVVLGVRCFPDMEKALNWVAQMRRYTINYQG